MATMHDDSPQYCYAEGLEDAIRFGIDAQEAGEELERIKQRDRTIVPEVVVDEARPEDAVLHPAFEWEDPVAAERYRVIQAQQLIKRVRVICPEPTAEPTVQARIAMPTAPVEPAITEHDPLAHDLSRSGLGGNGYQSPAWRQLRRVERGPVSSRPALMASARVAAMTSTVPSVVVTRQGRRGVIARPPALADQR
jgi:hypothetical protein